MSRYIDADAVLREACKRFDYVYDFEEVLDAIPTADVRENIKGRWILTEDDNYEYCTCSECGYQNGENWTIGSDIPFCEMCGADMRGDKE